MVAEKTHKFLWEFILVGIGSDNLSLHQQILNKVTINLDMFEMLMENRIVGSKNSSLIVTTHLHRIRNINTQVMKERANSLHLRSSMSHNSIFSIRTRMGDNILCFTRTSNEITFDKDTKIKSGPLIRATTSLVSISLKPVTYNYLLHLALPEECSMWLPNFCEHIGADNNTDVIIWMLTSEHFYHLTTTSILF